MFSLHISKLPTLWILKHYSGLSELSLGSYVLLHLVLTLSYPSSYNVNMLFYRHLCVLFILQQWQLFRLQNSVFLWSNTHKIRFVVLMNKTNRCTEFQFYWYYDSTCFGQPFFPSSEVLSHTSALVHFMQLWWPFATRSRMERHPANRTHNPQLHTRPTTWKPQHEIPQAATNV
jgi:hypothetical protein